MTSSFYTALQHSIEIGQQRYATSQQNPVDRLDYRRKTQKLTANNGRGVLAGRTITVLNYRSNASLWTCGDNMIGKSATLANVRIIKKQLGLKTHCFVHIIQLT